MNPTHISRRAWMATGVAGVGLPGFLAARASASPPRDSAAKSCIIVYCWGGMSHHETWDTKPDAPSEIRGEFSPIPSATTGIQVGEHIPQLARLTEKLAIVRSVHHKDSEHGRGMYWNLTGHRPTRVGSNLPPLPADWPTLAAMIAKFRKAPKGLPKAVRLPYPMVDNNTLQAGEYGGWLGPAYDPVVIKTPRGKAFGGVSRSLGSEVLELRKVDTKRLGNRVSLRDSLERQIGQPSDFESFRQFREVAHGILCSPRVRNAYNLDKEPQKNRESYGDHIGGQSLLLARRLIEAGVPIVQVCCAAGDLNGGNGDMWDTHRDNFNRLKKNLLPVFDRGASALLRDLSRKGMLDETLVVFLTEFGRTPRINKSAGRDHYPSVYSVAFAGGGIRGGQVYGSSDNKGAFPRTRPCEPGDLHATIFKALGISPDAMIHDKLGRPFPLCNGKPLPLF